MRVGDRIEAYRLVREAGRGAMATVYEAEDERCGRRVAVKVLRSGTLPLAGVSADRQEANALSRLNHPNVVSLYDAGETEASGKARPYLVMEFLEGETLEARLRRCNTLCPQDAAVILDGVAAGLDATHAAGIIHRDIKPANVMLCAAPGTDAVDVKLTDFGVALLSEEEARAQAGMLTGSPSYLSPEQIRGEAATTACDLWALGVMLYEMLTGIHPFTREPIRGAAAETSGGTGMGVASVVYRIMHGTTPPADTLESISAATRAVLLRALDPDPARRYPSAKALADAFRESLASGAVVVAAASVEEVTSAKVPVWRVPQPQQQQRPRPTPVHRRPTALPFALSKLVRRPGTAAIR